MRRSTAVFFVRFSGLQPAAEVRDQDSPKLIAAVDHTEASASAVANVATLLNRYFPTLPGGIEGVIVLRALNGIGGCPEEC
jgi:hypothetical protein